MSDSEPPGQAHGDALPTDPVAEGPRLPAATTGRDFGEPDPLDLCDEPALASLLERVADRLSQPPDELTKRRHLAALAAARGTTRRAVGRRVGLGITAGIAAAAVSLAVAGLLPPPVQRLASETVSQVGIELPRGRPTAPDPSPRPDDPAGPSVDGPPADPVDPSLDSTHPHPDPTDRSPDLADPSYGPAGAPAEVPAAEDPVPGARATDPPPGAPKDVDRAPGDHAPNPHGRHDARSTHEAPAELTQRDPSTTESDARTPRRAPAPASRHQTMTEPNAVTDPVPPNAPRESRADHRPSPPPN